VKKKVEQLAVVAAVEKLGLALQNPKTPLIILSELAHNCGLGVTPATESPPNGEML